MPTASSGPAPPPRSPARAGLLRVRGDRLDVFDKRHGLPADAIRTLEVQRTLDGIQVLWLATEGGIVRVVLADTPWMTASRHGARDNGVLGLLLEPDGRGGERLWIGSARDGLGLLERGHWHFFTHAALHARRRRSPDGVRPRHLAPAGSGRTAPPNHRPLRRGAARDQGRTDDRPVRHALDAAPRGHGDERAGENARRRGGVVDRGAAERPAPMGHGRWTSYSLADRPGLWRAFAIAEQIDDRGRSWLWTATAQGLARFDRERWHPVRETAGLPEDAYYSVMLLDGPRRKELWAGTLRNGLIRLDVSDPRHPRRLVDAPTQMGPKSCGRASSSQAELADALDRRAGSRQARSRQMKIVCRDEIGVLRFLG